VKSKNSRPIHRVDNAIFAVVQLKPVNNIPGVALEPPASRARLSVTPAIASEGFFPGKFREKTLCESGFEKPDSHNSNP